MRLQNFVGMRAFGDDCYRAVVPLLCQRCAVRETVPPRFGVPVFLFKYAEPLFVNLAGLPAVTASLSRELAAILKECLERALDNRSGDLSGNFRSPPLQTGYRAQLNFRWRNGILYCHFFIYQPRVGSVRCSPLSPLKLPPMLADAPTPLYCTPVKNEATCMTHTRKRSPCADTCCA